MAVLFGIVSAFCLGYYIFAASYAGVGSSFLSFWILAFFGCAALSVFFYLSAKRNWMEHIPRFLKLTVTVCVIVGVLLFLVLEGMILSKMRAVPEGNVEYLVVLGAQVRGKRVTKSLAKRLDAAFDYAKKEEHVIVIVSGGQGIGEDISEAEAMKKYLLEKGLSENRIVMEDKSTTTKENLVFSREKMKNPDACAGVVTNNFHVYRGMKLAETLGYRNVQGLAGKSDNRLLLNYMVREAFAILKEYLVGNIA